MNLHPFRWVPPPARPAVFFASMFLALVLFIALQMLDRPLQTAAAPNGIVSFELAGSQAAAHAILAGWGHEGQLYAALSLGLDYLFLFVYATAIGLACVLVGRGIGGWRSLNRVAVLLSWAMIAAALLDAVENLAMIEILLGAQESYWAPLARQLALVKFAIVTVALVFAGVGGPVALLRRARRA